MNHPPHEGGRHHDDHKHGKHHRHHGRRDGDRPFDYGAFRPFSLRRIVKTPSHGDGRMKAVEAYVARAGSADADGFAPVPASVFRAMKNAERARRPGLRAPLDRSSAAAIAGTPDAAAPAIERS